MREDMYFHTLCTECGPDVPIDEEGCCLQCGAFADGVFATKILNELDVLRRLVVNVGTSGAESDDEHLDYVVVQVDRKLWEECQSATKKILDKGLPPVSGGYLWPGEGGEDVGEDEELEGVEVPVVPLDEFSGKL